MTPSKGLLLFAWVLRNRLQLWSIQDLGKGDGHGIILNSHHSPACKRVHSECLEMQDTEPGKALSRCLGAMHWAS